MKREKCDVVVRLDEASGKLVLEAIPSSRLDSFFQQPHAAWVGQVADLRALGHEQAEALVGLKVLRELDRHSAAGLKLRDFEALEREELKTALAELEARAAAGEADAQFEAFRALWNQALKQKSLALLLRADAYLNAAVAQGHAPAVAFAVVWPRLRAEAEAGIGHDAA